MQDLLIHFAPANNPKNFQTMTFFEFYQIAMNILLEALGKTTIEGASIYAVAALAGVSLTGPGLLAATGIALVCTGKDSYSADFDKGFDIVYNACLESANSMGKNIYEDKAKGIIKGRISDANVTIKVVKTLACT